MINGSKIFFDYVENQWVCCTIIPVDLHCWLVYGLTVRTMIYTKAVLSNIAKLIKKHC